MTSKASLMKKGIAFTLALMMCLTLVSAFLPTKVNAATPSSGTYEGIAWHELATE